MAIVTKQTALSCLAVSCSFCVHSPDAGGTPFTCLCCRFIQIPMWSPSHFCMHHAPSQQPTCRIGPRLATSRFCWKHAISARTLTSSPQQIPHSTLAIKSHEQEAEWKTGRRQRVYWFSATKKEKEKKGLSVEGLFVCWREEWALRFPWSLGWQGNKKREEFCFVRRRKEKKEVSWGAFLFSFLLCFKRGRGQ